MSETNKSECLNIEPKPVIIQFNNYKRHLRRAVMSVPIDLDGVANWLKAVARRNDWEDLPDSGSSIFLEIDMCKSVSIVASNSEASD